MSDASETSKAAFYVSGDYPEIGRALLVAGVDFIRPGAWLSEAFAVFTHSPLSDGGRIVTTYDHREIPPEILPSIDLELGSRLEYAESLFWQKVRAVDPELSLWLRKAGEQFNGPLTDYGVARQHLSGDFGNQICDLLSFTECRAIRETISTFERLPMFEIRREPRR